MKHINDKILIHLYHATNMGSEPFNPVEVKERKSLLESGYIEIVKCSEAPNSPHNSGTCNIKIGWLTKKGVEKARETLFEDIDKRIEHVLSMFNDMNPRVAGIVKYMVRCRLYPNYDYIKGMKRLSIFKLAEYMPRYVLKTYKDVLDKLVEAGLATYASKNHTTSGWNKETFTMAEHVKWRYLGRQGGKSLPLIVDIAAYILHSLKMEEELIGEALLSRGIDIFKYHNYMREEDHIFHKVSTIMLSSTDMGWFKGFEKPRQIKDIELKTYTEIYQRYSRSSDKWILNLAGNTETIEHEVNNRSYRRYSIAEKMVERLLHKWIETGMVEGMEIDNLELIPER